MSMEHYWYDTERGQLKCSSQCPIFHW